MTLLDHVQSKVPMRKVGAGEWHGPCPGCGTNQKNPAFSDRFSVREGIGGEADRWFCRNCGHGDLIDFLRTFCGYSFAEAAKEAGKELPEQREYQTPKFCPPAQAAKTFEPRDIQQPADKWSEHAEKFAQACHQRLLDMGDAEGTPLHYLAQRGINRQSAITFRLGWNNEDAYRARESWGLETVLRDDSKPKKLWLPVGLVIPFYQGDHLRRLRIRIPQERRTGSGLPYYLVPGSSMDTFIAGSGAKAYVITEAELDAILVYQEAGDLAGAMAMGNNSAKPTAEAHQLLAACLHISNALDYDAGKDAQGRYTNPGGKAALWWTETYPQAERWPVPVGKDPGDLFKAGISICEWVFKNLPPVLTLPKAQPVQRIAPNITSPAPNITSPAPKIEPKCSESQDHDKSGAVCSAAAVEAAGPRPMLAKLKSKSGHDYYITDSPDEYRRLQAESATVFSPKEIEAIKQAQHLGATDHDLQVLFESKRVLGGFFTQTEELRG